MPSVPGVLNPLLARMASRALMSHSGWQMSRYNLPKRLSGWCAASLARCVCSCLTLFTGLVPSSFGTKTRSTLPPFPMCTALPCSEYYGGSPPDASSVSSPPIPPLGGGDTHLVLPERHVTLPTHAR